MSLVYCVFLIQLLFEVELPPLSPVSWTSRPLNAIKLYLAPPSEFTSAEHCRERTRHAPGYQWLSTGNTASAGNGCRSTFPRAGG